MFSHKAAQHDIVSNSRAAALHLQPQSQRGRRTLMAATAHSAHTAAHLGPFSAGGPLIECGNMTEPNTFLHWPMSQIAQIMRVVLNAHPLKKRIGPS